MSTVRIELLEESWHRLLAEARMIGADMARVNQIYRLSVRGPEIHLCTTGGDDPATYVATWADGRLTCTATQGGADSARRGFHLMQALLPTLRPKP